MTDLVCLMSSDSDAEGRYRISYILPEDDKYVEFWMSDRWVEGYHKLKPYEDGDVAMTTGNRIMFGLQILFKYDRNLQFNPGHDEVWAGAKGMTYEEMCAIMSEEDIKKMDRLGWSEDEESWHYFT